jgi:tetratricopeptide (TPR) repeat protein
MKYSILLFICVAGRSLFAQGGTDNIYGSWVKTKLTYKNGAELPDENILKNTYVKYTFTAPDKINIAGVYFENGTPFNFEIQNNEIILKTAVGSAINTIRIVELSADKMVLLQEGYQGFDDPTALKYTFVRETAFQNLLPLNAGDIYSVTASDTIYKQNPQIYANFKRDSFQGYLYAQMGASYHSDTIGNHLAASFIVSKTGVADSLKILEGMGPGFDKAFAKAFNKDKNDWKPAVLNGKYVAVQMFVELTYGTFGPAFSADQYTRKADIAFKQKDYQAALYYYDQALKSIPTDKENLYNRGFCKKMLGNLAGACEDWKKIKTLGGTQADDLLAKYCH